MSIKEDKNRFREIIKGKVRDNLKKYISQHTMTGKKENDKVTIPVHSIDIPNFRFGKDDQQEGVGSGGEEGVDQKNGSQGDGKGNKPGDQEGEHTFDTEFTISELASMLGEALELPMMEPKGHKNVDTKNNKYSSLSQVGPDGLRHFKHTYKKALKKSISGGSYNPANPNIIPNRADYVYRAAKPTTKPQAQAVVFYMMDISGSMGEKEKKVVQSTTFWINAWLQKHYKGLETRFIVHDAKAWEVKDEEFFTIAASGGTLISSSYECCLNIIEQDYPPNDWNIYIFQFSDGDNWSAEDSKKCMDLLRNKFFPIVNMFNYGQVESQYGSGGFMKELELARMYKEDKIRLTSIKGQEGIMNSIKDFLGKNKG